MGQQNNEGFAVQAADHHGFKAVFAQVVVVAAHAAHQAACHTAEHLLAGRRPKQSAHLMEAVQLHMQQAQPRSRAFAKRACMRDAGIGAVHERAPVRQPGKRVAVCQTILIHLQRQAVAHPQNQLTGVHRFGQKFGGTEVKRTQLGGWVAGGGEHDHRHVAQLFVGAHLRQDVKARHLGHHQIQQHQ